VPILFLLPLIGWHRSYAPAIDLNRLYGDSPRFPRWLDCSSLILFFGGTFLLTFCFSHDCKPSWRSARLLFKKGESFVWHIPTRDPLFSGERSPLPFPIAMPPRRVPGLLYSFLFVLPFFSPQLFSDGPPSFLFASGRRPPAPTSADDRHARLHPAKETPLFLALSLFTLLPVFFFSFFTPLPQIGRCALLRGYPSRPLLLLLVPTILILVDFSSVLSPGPASGEAPSLKPVSLSVSVVFFQLFLKFPLETTHVVNAQVPWDLSASTPLECLPFSYSTSFVQSEFL